MVLRIYTLQVTHKLLSLRLSTADTLTFQWKAIEQTFNGTQGFGQSVTATISRNGDLVHRMYLEHEVDFAATSSTSIAVISILRNYGNRLMKRLNLKLVVKELIGIMVIGWRRGQTYLYSIQLEILKLFLIKCRGMVLELQYLQQLLLKIQH